MTTKILAVTDARGHRVRFVLLPGQRYDTVGLSPLFDGVRLKALIADKAFDGDAMVKDLVGRGAKVVIFQRPRRTSPRTIDAEMYKRRRPIENYFRKLEEFKRIVIAPTKPIKASQPSSTSPRPSSHHDESKQARVITKCSYGKDAGPSAGYRPR